MLRSISIALAALGLACGSAVALVLGTEVLTDTPAATPLQRLAPAPVTLADPVLPRVPAPATDAAAPIRSTADPAGGAPGPLADPVLSTRAFDPTGLLSDGPALTRSSRPVPRTDAVRARIAVPAAPDRPATTARFERLATNGVYR